MTVLYIGILQMDSSKISDTALSPTCKSPQDPMPWGYWLLLCWLLRLLHTLWLVQIRMIIEGQELS